MKHARISMGGKSRGPLFSGTETSPTTTTKSRRPTQPKTARSLANSEQAEAVKNHPMVLQLEQAHTRILQETMDSIRRGTTTISQTLTNNLATQSECTYESLQNTIDLFNSNAGTLTNTSVSNTNRTTAIPFSSQAAGTSSKATAAAMAMHLTPALRMIIDKHTEAVSRIATEVNQWTVELLSALVGASLGSGRTLGVDSLSALLAQQQQHYQARTKGPAPLSPVSPTTTSPQQQQFRFDRRATTIRRMLEECKRYKVCKYQDRYLGYDKATQFHSYRAEERYIQARMVVSEEVRFIVETRGGGSGNSSGGTKGDGEEEAIGWLEREFLKMDGSTARFLEILKERQKLRKSQARRV
ncbi:hypothetical protein BGZ96_007690 [Linnemannia gamsii]|uniref:Uncharacterized protein n=1 Tax=Linnemannia gamsii TaxID=64522 RepID=A0ABQ7K0N2_9FUNG|nr:hypothetical protein BGZ96_007690 [Linnemannia gamsii]